MCPRYLSHSVSPRDCLGYVHASSYIYDINMCTVLCATRPWPNIDKYIGTASGPLSHSSPLSEDLILECSYTSGQWGPSLPPCPLLVDGQDEALTRRPLRPRVWGAGVRGADSSPRSVEAVPEGRRPAASTQIPQPACHVFAARPTARMVIVH